MKIGIMTDIHEHVDPLRAAIASLKRMGAERLMSVGDICETHDRLDETVELLEAAGVFGVWGNHDYGLCVEDPALGPEVQIEDVSERVLRFMRTLKPRIQFNGFLFSHVEPWLDPNKLEDLWYFAGLPKTPEQIARIFNAPGDWSVAFSGHYHTWLHATPAGLQPWNGQSPLILDLETRHFVTIHAICDGFCALLDTDSRTLTPVNL